MKSINKKFFIILVVILLLSQTILLSIIFSKVIRIKNLTFNTLVEICDEGQICIIEENAQREPITEQEKEAYVYEMLAMNLRETIIKMDEVDDATIKITKENDTVFIHAEIVQNPDNNLSESRLSDIRKFLLGSVSGATEDNTKITVK